MMTISSELPLTIAPAAGGRGAAVATGDIQTANGDQATTAGQLFGDLLARQSGGQATAAQGAEAHGKKDTVPVEISMELSGDVKTGNVKTGDARKTKDNPSGKDGKPLTDNALAGMILFPEGTPLKNLPSEQKQFNQPAEQETAGTENIPQTPTVKNTGDETSVGGIILAADTEASASSQASVSKTASASAKIPEAQIPDKPVTDTISPVSSETQQDSSFPSETPSDKGGLKDSLKDNKATARHDNGPVIAQETARTNTPQEENAAAAATVTPQAAALDKAAKTDPAPQLAAAVILPAEQNRMEDSRNNKNTATNTVKITPENTPEKGGVKGAETSTENGTATNRENPGLKEAGKKNTDLSAKAKATSHTPDARRNFIEGLQDKPSVTSHQPLETASTPLPANTGQTPAITEGKIAGSGPAQLQTGLLSLQDVSQNSVHNIKNLTSANQARINPNINPNHATPQMVAKQIGLAIARQTSDGKHSFKISLKPADLGHVDIRMDIQTDGRVTATITADNQRTLNLLHRDQGSLQRALTNSGFDAGGSNLNFTLKQQQQNPAEYGYTANVTGDTEDDGIMPLLPHDIISQQHMRMTYSDNILDINI